MFKKLTKNCFTFEGVNKNSFEIYNEGLIEELLGKSGKQTTINFGGSLWVKIITRHKTEKQKKSIKLNPKYFELKSFFKDNVIIDEGLLKLDVENLTKKLVDNLEIFKSDGTKRKEILKLLFDDDLKFKDNIPMEYSYILFALYCALNYSYYERNEEVKFKPINFTSLGDFKTKYFEILNDEKYKIANLTCFSYRQYFWADFRLSSSPTSEIHSIIYNIFQELSPKDNQQKSDRGIESFDFDPEDITIEGLLNQDKTFIVPDYQRLYSWSAENIKSFLKDFFEFIYEERKTVKHYFLGTFVILKKDDRFEIIDGQQRLTTIIIFLNVLKELTTDKSLKNYISKFIISEKPGTDQKIVEIERLVLNRNNEDYFRRFFISKKAESLRLSSDVYGVTKSQGSNYLIYSTHKQIKEYIEDFFNTPIQTDKITELVSLLLEKIKIVKIEVKTEQSANTLFETLNDRGLTLKQHENIKNHIFGRTLRDFKILKSSWNNLLNIYGDKFEKYLFQIYRSNFSSKYKDFSKSKLYRHFKDNDEIKNYLDFVLMLENEILIYESLIRPTEDIWKRKEVFSNLELINSFNVEGIFVLLLSSKVKNFYFNEILKSCVAVVFKNKFSGQLPHDLNDLSFNLSSKIRKFETKKQSESGDDFIKRKSDLFSEIKKALNNVVKISSEQIKQSFLYNKIYEKQQRNIVLRILREINKLYLSDSSINWDKTSVEHIYKQNTASDDFKKEIIAIETKFANIGNKTDYNENSIYNLTLLPAKENNEEKTKNNLTSSKKIELYKKHENFETNKKIVELYNKGKKYDYGLIKSYNDFLWKNVQKIFYLD